MILEGGPAHQQESRAASEILVSVQNPTVSCWLYLTRCLAQARLIGVSGCRLIFLPQADFELSLVDLDSSVESPCLWPSFRTFSAAMSAMAWESVSGEAPQGQEGVRDDGERPLGLPSYNGEIICSVTLGLRPRGAPRSLLSIRHLPLSSPPLLALGSECWWAPPSTPTPTEDARAHCHL